jgi:uncharacterized protein (DUF433 family)
MDDHTVQYFDNTAAYIMRTPAKHRGRPFIVDTNIRVQDIYMWHEDVGMPVDEISERTNLTLACIYAALSFAHEYRDAIEAAITSDQQRGIQQPMPPGGDQQKLRAHVPPFVQEITQDESFSNGTSHNGTSHGKNRRR